MSIEDEIALLQRSPTFRGVDAARLRLLVVSSDRLRIPAGERIYERGDPSEDVLLILSGRVRATHGHPHGTLVGHLGALLQRPRQTSIVAETNVEALRLGREDFVAVLKGCNQLSLAVMLDLARNLDTTLRSDEQEGTP